MLRSLLALPLLLGIAAATSAADRSPDPKSLIVPPAELTKARELVQLLGSEEFSVREEAENDLGKMGRAAHAALLNGVLSDSNPEVRSRCEALLPRATALEMKARLEVFLADTDGKYEHDLPGWNQFRATVRNEWSILGFTLVADHSLDQAARKVFAELISTPVNRQVVMAVGGSEPQLGSLTAARRQELFYQRNGRIIIRGGAIANQPIKRREITADDVATLMFAESQVSSKFVPVAPRNVSISVLISTSGFTNAIQIGDEKGKVYKAIAAAWLESRRETMDLYYSMNAAPQLGLPEYGLKLAIRLFEGKNAAGSYRGMAAANIARLGNKSHIPLLEKAMTDETVIATVRQNVVKNGMNELVAYEFQTRDVALAVAIMLAGENPKDYGFADLFGAGAISGASYSYTRLYLTEETRKAAFEKWKAQRDKDKKGK